MWTAPAEVASLREHLAEQLQEAVDARAQIDRSPPGELWAQFGSAVVFLSRAPATCKLQVVWIPNKRAFSAKYVELHPTLLYQLCRQLFLLYQLMVSPLGANLRIGLGWRKHQNVGNRSSHNGSQEHPEILPLQKQLTLSN